MGADQSFALPFYEKLATHYAHSRQSDPQISGIALDSLQRLSQSLCRPEIS